MSELNRAPLSLCIYTPIIISGRTRTFCAQGLSEFSAPEATEVGYLVGKVNVVDADIGRNTEVTYSIVEGDGLDMFKITTDTATQGGVISVKKVRDAVK